MKIIPEEDKGTHNPINNRNGESDHNSDHHGNRLTPHDDNAAAAIDAMLDSSEQSYAQFMANFLFLTPGDLRRQEQRQTNALVQRLMPSVASKHEDNSPPSATQGESSAATNQQAADIEEEVLGEGTKVPHILTRSADTASAGSIKVDNFVEMEDEDILEDDSSYCPGASGEYSASFEDEIVADKAKGLRLSSQKTEQSEMHKNAQASLSSAEDALSRIRSKADPNEESLLDMISCDPNLDSSDAECTSEGSDEFAPDCYPEPCNLTVQNDKQQTDEELKYNPELDLLNPGEIQVIDDSSSVQNVDIEQNDTHLDFKVAQSSKSEDANNPCIKTCSNLVEPFSLDEDFDYDNVVLTPKFSAAEMEILNKALAGASVANESECGDEYSGVV